MTHIAVSEYDPSSELSGCAAENMCGMSMFDLASDGCSGVAADLQRSEALMVSRDEGAGGCLSPHRDAEDAEFGQCACQAPC